MVTPLDIITTALDDAGVLGVGQTPLFEDANKAFNKLNGMIAQWQRKRWLIPYLVDTGIVSTGAQSYTIGPTGDIAIVRPDRLEDGCYLRQLVNSAPNAVDSPLELIEARETYSQIALKELTSFANYIFYDASYPLGRIYPYPIPAAGIYEIHILTKATLGAFTSLNQTIILPDEYIPALEWNLAQRLRIAYRLPKDEELNKMARDSLNLIRGANAQIPRLKMPTALIRGALYNIYADTTY